MGQRSDQLNIDDPEATVIMRPDELHATYNDVSSEDIEQTRTQMSGTLAAIGDKLNPHALAQEAKDVASDATQQVKEAVPEIAAEVVGHAKDVATEVTQHAKEAITEAAAEAAQHLRDAAADVIQHVKETLPEVAANAGHHAVSGAVKEAKDALGGAVNTAKGASMTLLDRIKQNPIPATVAGLGLYWLLRGQNQNAVAGQSYGSNSGMGSRSYGTSSNYGTPQYKEQTPTPGQAVGQVISNAGSKVGAVAGQAQDVVGSAVDHVQDTAGHVMDRVQGTAQHSTDWFQQTLQQNPLGAVAMAVALGTVIGLTVPETDQENRLMGETRDTLMQKAQDKVQGTVQDLGGKAQDALGKVADKVSS